MNNRAVYTRNVKKAKKSLCTAAYVFYFLTGIYCPIKGGLMKLNWLKQILTNNNRFSVHHTEYRRVILLNFVLIALIGTCLFFSLVGAFIVKSNLSGIAVAVNGTAAAGALVTLIIFHKTDNIKTVTLATVFIFLLTLSVFLLFSQHKNYGLYWISIFPLLVYFLLNRKTAHIITLAYSALLLVFILTSNKNWEPAPFNLSSILNICGATFGIILVVGYFEISRREVYQMLEEKNRELERLAVTDHLTGLYNRTKLDEIIAAEINRTSRTGKKFSVIMADIDYFKSVNDKYGHITGDAVLTDIGGLLLKNCRKTDYVGRWGGEEFLVICPETDEKGAIILAEKLLGSVAAYRYMEGEKITMSLGAASLRPGDSWDSLLKRADDALYAAKYKGRCRVELI